MVVKAGTPPSFGDVMTPPLVATGFHLVVTTINFLRSISIDIKKVISWGKNAAVVFHMTSLKSNLKKISILPGFYFHDALEQLKTNLHTNFRFKRVLGFVFTLLSCCVTRHLRDAQESCHVG